MGYDTTPFIEDISPASARKQSFTAREHGDLIPKSLEIFAEFGEKAVLNTPTVRGAAFPTQALDGVMLQAVDGIRQEMPYTPDDIICQSLLAVATTAVSGYADVVMNSGRVTSLNNFYLTVGESSSGKTSGMKRAMYPIEKHSQAVNSEYRVWVANKAQFDATKTSRSERYDVPEPWSGVYIQNDFTTEALLMSLVKHPLLTVANSEAGNFFDGYSFKKSRINTAAVFSALWDGHSVARNRAKDDGIIVRLDNRRVSMHLMIQPELANDLFISTDIQRQGFLSRFLMVSPSVYPEYDSLNDLDKDYRHANALSAPFFDVVSMLLHSINYSLDFELSKRQMEVERSARKAYLEYIDETRALSVSDYTDVKESALKMPQHLLKLAATLELINYPASLEVSNESMQKALLLCRFYLDEAKRLIGNGKVGADYTDAQALWNWLDNNRDKCKDNVILQSVIARLCPNRLRQTSTIKKLCLQLVQHGYLRPVSDINKRAVKWELAA